MAAPGDGPQDPLRRVSAISNVAPTFDSPQGTLLASEPGTPNQAPSLTIVGPEAQPQDEPPVAESLEVPASWLQKTLLTFDGGGIRGYSSLLMLSALMIHIGRIEQSYNEAHSTSYKPCEKPTPSKLKSRETNLEEGAYSIEYLPCHYFDYIAGTSTGGLIATMLSRWRMSVKECIEQYKVVGSEIFGDRRRLSVLGYPRCKHSKKPLIAAITSLANQMTPETAGGSPKPEFQMFPAPPDLCRTILFAIRKGKITRNPDETTTKSRLLDGPFLFRSYIPIPFDMNNPPENYGVDINHEIWKVCRATTAAQFYFESQKIGDEEFCDGGAGVNNPTGKALEEMFSLHKTNVEVVASFGTGKWEPPSMFRAGNANRLNRLHIGSAIAHVNRLLKNAKGALTECERTHEEVQKLASLVRDTPDAFKYFRFNVEDDLGKVKMNEWEDRRDDGDKGKCSTLAYITKCTNRELERPQVQERLRELATLLVAQRRKRIKDDPDMWARFASCIRYKCADDGCRIDGELRYFSIRREMREHLRTVHNTQPESMEVELDRCRKLPDFPTGPF